MANELPKNFEPVPPLGIASYDYIDLASGLGYQTYYGVCQSFPASSLAPYTTANPQYFLMDGNATSLYPEQPYTDTSTTATLNFDSSPFKISRLVTGKVFINFLVQNIAGSTTNCTFSARLYKWNGSTETAITALQTLDYNGNNAPATAMGSGNKVNFLALIDATDTIISAGEQLRLKVVLTDVDAESIRVYHDPLGRDSISDTNYSTQMKIKVPFKND